MGRKTVHEDIYEVLPWFVNESLAGKQRQVVMAHLRQCPECREERDRLQALQQVVIEDDGSTTTDYRPAFRRLMKRIAVAEANRESTSEVIGRRRMPAWVPYFAVAASLLLAIVFVGMMNPANKGPEEYRTLSNTSDLPGVPHRIALTFEQPLRAETIRAALIETHSDIVSGPDKHGTYIVNIKVPKNMSDSRFIASLRQIKGVRNAAFDGKAPSVAP